MELGKILAATVIIRKTKSIVAKPREKILHYEEMFVYQVSAPEGATTNFRATDL